MRICRITANFPPLTGGSSINTFYLSKTLIRIGHEEHVVTPHSPNETSDINIHLIRTIKFPPLTTFFRAISMAKAAFNVVKKKRVDIIHAHNLDAPGIAGVIVSKITHRPLVVTAHSPWADCWGLKGIWLWLARKGEHFTLKHADRIITPSEVLKYELIAKHKLNPECIEVIPWGVDLHLFSERKNDIKEELNLGQRKIVLFVGPLTRFKGLEYLIQAIPKIVSELSNVAFLIVGDGPLKNRLQTLSNCMNISPFVFFMGDQPHSKVADFYAASDVFILPSLYETFGVVLGEAMASGLPIIATRICGFCKNIEDEKFVILINPQDIDQLAAAISQVLADGKLAENMGKNAKTWAAKNLNWETTASSTAKIYEEIKKS